MNSFQDSSTPVKAIAPKEAMGLVEIDVLIVDNGCDDLQPVVNILTAKYNCVRVVSEAQFLQKLEQRDLPGLILLNTKQLNTDIYVLCREIRSECPFCEVPILILFEAESHSEMFKCFDLGRVDYLTKPVRSDELLARIKRLLAPPKKLANQEFFFRAIYENVEAVITVIDVLDDGTFRVAEVNKAALRMTGLTRDEIEGMDLRKFVSEEEIRLNHQACVDTGLPITREKPVKLNGDMTWWLSTQMPIRNSQGKISRLLTTSINITDRKRAEIELSEKTKALSQALEDLKATQKELIQSEKMAVLGNLVAGVSHEINTPVGTALISASTLNNATEAIATELNSQENLSCETLESYLDLATECSDLILVNLRRAGELIKTFQKVAVDQTSLQARTFALTTYVREIVHNLSPRLKSTPHRITISGDDELMLFSYPGAIAQIINNLVLNSIIHAYPDNTAGNLCISISEGSNSVILEYSDDGCGIPVALQQRIFEPFTTASSNRSGSGLGLHIVYNLVTQKLRGTIQLEALHQDALGQNISSVNRGTKFTITLPSQLKS